MKKLFVISLMALTILIGGISMDAKTTKKGKSKARTSQSSTAAPSLSVSDFFNRNPNYNFYTYKDVSEISKNMEKLGFSYNGDEDGGYYEYEDGTLDPLQLLCYQKGSTEVLVYVDENNKIIRYIGIKFGSSTEKNNFIRVTKNKVGDSNLYVRKEHGIVYIGCYEH